MLNLYKGNCLNRLRGYFSASILFFTFFSESVFADESPSSKSPSQNEGKSRKEVSSPCSILHPILEGKIGYFFFTDSKMNEIYDNGGYDFQISASYPVRRYLQVYGSIEYQEARGSSLQDHQATSIWKVPVSLGLRGVIFLCPTKTQYYFTLGPRYFFVHQHNSSSYVDRNVTQNGLGGFANMGFVFFLYRNLRLDVFGEYSYERTRVHSSETNVYTRNVQIGVVSLGIGIGHTF